MDTDLLVAVEVPLLGDERRKNWAKVVHNVDPAKASGWAFEGEFIATGGVQDVPVGCVILVYGERGSRTNPQIEARAFTVNGDGTLTLGSEAKGRAWARTLRDDVERLVADAGGEPIAPRPWEPVLVGYSDGALVEELERRGYRVRLS